MSTHTIEETIVRFAEPTTCKTPTFLNPPEFVSLAISRRKLVRSDEPGSTVRGLFEPATGNRYLIEAAQLRDRGLT
jgi:hypothetical protein